jgi:nicotinate-nucleotide pyrophosphorylase (carboxylating)
MHELANVFIDRIVDRALEEDLSSGDVTTEACVDPSVQAVAHAVARTPLIACGAAVFARVWTRLDPQLRVEQHLADGARASRAAALWTVRGRARSILMGERVALNLTQRMCGVATATRLYVDAIPAGCAARITDTRKTTPGLRVLERYAVRTGGGYNHRDNLGAAVLINDNHVVASGGVRQAILRAKQFASHTCKIECEVDTLEQLEEALEAGADIVLLDNMDTDTVIEAIRRTGSRAMLEASGGITLARVRELALAGIHAISVGALTHSTVASDIGLDFEVA